MCLSTLAKTRRGGERVPDNRFSTEALGLMTAELSEVLGDWTGSIQAALASLFPSLLFLCLAPLSTLTVA